MRCSARHALFRPSAENDKVCFSQPSKLQNLLSWIASFHKVLGLAPGFGFGRYELAQQILGRRPDISGGNKVAGLLLGNDVQKN